MTTRIQFWTKKQFEAVGVFEPVCDLCDVALKEFPVPVVHHPFDLAVAHFDNLGRKTGGYAVRGGMAMCLKCFDATTDELEKKGEEVITVYECGCLTQRIGHEFIVKPCSFTCETYKIILAKSKAKNNRIDFRSV